MTAALYTQQQQQQQQHNKKPYPNATTLRVATIKLANKLDKTENDDEKKRMN